MCVTAQVANFDMAGYTSLPTRKSENQIFGGIMKTKQVRSYHNKAKVVIVEEKVTQTETGYLQLTNPVEKWIEENSPVPVRVALHIAKHSISFHKSRSEMGHWKVSNQDLAKELGLNVSTLKDALRQLKEGGIITTTGAPCREHTIHLLHVPAAAAVLARTGATQTSTMRSALPESSEERTSAPSFVEDRRAKDRIIAQLNAFDADAPVAVAPARTEDEMPGSDIDSEVPEQESSLPLADEQDVTYWQSS